jgi:hypothetical protein
MEAPSLRGVNFHTRQLHSEVMLELYSLENKQAPVKILQNFIQSAVDSVVEMILLEMCVSYIICIH